MDDLKLFLLLYADDAVILAQSAEDLQKGLNCLETYCKRYKLTVNTDKTRIMIFKKGGRNIASRWHFGDKELEIVRSFKYLGIVFTTTGSFTEAQKTLASQGEKALFALYKYLYKFVNINVRHKLDLFDKLIEPILSYGSEVWGFTKVIM